MLQPSPTNPIVTQATSHPQHSGIETASDLLARPLPILTQEIGTPSPIKLSVIHFSETVL
jgi:hypothetical protein